MTRPFNRRQFLRHTTIATVAASTFGGLTARVLAATPGYSGKLLMCVHLTGGVDVTSWCDPKENTPGEKKINNWADSAASREAGRIPYAPFANNSSFFDRHFRDLLVVNGVDAQTNSHQTGTFYNWTGYNAEGKPTLAALFAAAQSPDQPLAYVSYGGYSNPGEVIRMNRFGDPRGLKSTLDPYDTLWGDGSRWRSAEQETLLSEANDRMLETLLAETRSPRKRRHLLNMINARSAKSQLGQLKALLPDSYPEPVQTDDGVYLNTKAQLLSALLTFKAGIGSAADVEIGGFDTHTRHDELHTMLLDYTAEALNFMWDEAERLEIDDRLVVVISSDFGRTNFYNSYAGKDHWPIGSHMVMERNTNWGNRVVGKTDAIHNALKINANTLAESSSGMTINPNHVHKALQKYLGIHDFTKARGLGFDSTTELPLFDGNKRTI